MHDPERLDDNLLVTHGTKLKNINEVQTVTETLEHGYRVNQQKNKNSQNETPWTQHIKRQKTARNRNKSDYETSSAIN